MKDLRTRQAKTMGRIALCLLLSRGMAFSATTASADYNEDSLLCARVEDSYAASNFKAAIWPRSAAYGAMTWCDVKVKAVEHCVPAEAVLHETTAPYEGYRGPDLQAEYTCYRIRCRNGEGDTYLGSRVTIEDTFGPRTADKPRIARICVPNR